jgi:hypothetical protein
LRNTSRRIALIATLLVSAPAAAQEPGPAQDHVVVRLYNTYAPAAQALDHAMAESARILHADGIDVSWRQCVLPAKAKGRAEVCDATLTPDEISVRLIVAPANMRDPDVLGYSHVDLRTGSGQLATVLADRVLDRSKRSRNKAEVLLGQVIAHEVGHLRYGAAHGGDGYMRAYLDLP